MAAAGANLVEQCRQAGVQQLLFVRHANAAPLPGTTPERVAEPHHWKRDDQMRLLTQRGHEQCAAASAWFHGLPVRCLLSSPARRASDTAALMAAGSDSATLSLHMVEGIHPAGMSETCEAMFEKHGYGPLRKFFEMEGGALAFGDYAKDVCEQLAASLPSAVGTPGEGAGGTCVAVFGHAVFLNAIAFQVARAAGCSTETEGSLLDMDLGETQGILVDLETGVIAKKTAAGAGGAALISTCRSAGLSHIVFVRHANAAPLANECPSRADKPHHWKREDQMRVLTDKGRQQCASASGWFTKLPVRSCVSSPARRASETAVNMLAAVESEEKPAGTVALQMVESVHPAGMSETAETLFETLGYGPLRKFFEAAGGDHAFRDYGDKVCTDLSGALATLPEGNGSCAAVFGHAVFLNAIALEACIAVGASGDTIEALLDLDLGETQGIFVDLCTGSLQHLGQQS
eukprot:TRINITY_DN4876_c1_g1_i1.p1 TRINITY_DN4876_c1_g1~~TRINITY_DN4876_c1_g1_i1.p1  ORF type:complete len:461 (+),score=67.37 TRINITY_DN4876_c1_g1_i1:79-1461(+)